MREERGNFWFSVVIVLLLLFFFCCRVKYKRIILQLCTTGDYSFVYHCRIIFSSFSKVPLLVSTELNKKLKVRIFKKQMMQILLLLLMTLIRNKT